MWRKQKRLSYQSLWYSSWSHHTFGFRMRASSPAENIFFWGSDDSTVCATLAGNSDVEIFANSTSTWLWGCSGCSGCCCTLAWVIFCMRVTTQTCCRELLSSIRCFSFEDCCTDGHAQFVPPPRAWTSTTHGTSFPSSLRQSINRWSYTPRVR